MSFEPIILTLNKNMDIQTNIKGTLIISVVISSIISTAHILLNYLFYCSSFLEQLSFPSFAFLSLFLGPEFLDYFHIIILTTSLGYTLLKIAYNVSILSNTKGISLKRSFFLLLLVFILTNLLYKYSSLNYNFILLILISINLILLIFSKKENYHEITSS